MALVTDTITKPKIVTGNVTLPASYATGGFVLDMTASMSFLEFLQLNITTVGVLPPILPIVTYNQDLSGYAHGKCVIKLMRPRYDRLASIDAITGPPSGVTTQAALFAAGTTTGSGHTHTISHDHGTLVSGTAVSGGVGVAGLGSVNLVNHNHEFTIPAFTGSSDSTTHTHNRAFEYQHNHLFTNTTTDVTAVEIANASDLSGTTIKYEATGF